MPNPVLTPVTLVWGIAACILFLRYRNIYTLGLAHGILGLCVAVWDQRQQRGEDDKRMG